MTARAFCVNHSIEVVYLYRYVYSPVVDSDFYKYHALLNNNKHEFIRNVENHIKSYLLAHCCLKSKEWVVANPLEPFELLRNCRESVKGLFAVRLPTVRLTSIESNLENDDNE